MILYLLKSIACLLILLLVHRLIFQREAIYKFNRFYLLAAVLGSFLIPLVEMEVSQEVTPTPVLVVGEVPNVQFDYAVNEVEYTSNIPNESIEAENPMDWHLILWGVYGLVTIVFLIRFIRNIHLLFDKIRRNIHVQFRGETLVLLPENSLPFSFLSYIFVSGDYFQSGQLTDSVFAHEQAHVRGLHSWDNLLIEGLLVIFWFHPGLYLARQAIKLNHEFIADAAALQITTLEHYKTFLLAMMLPDQNQGLVSSLNFSLTKKRFEMMKRKTANSTKWTLILVLVPILGALVYVFSEKVPAPVQTEQTGSSIIQESENSDEKETDILVRADGKLEIEGQVIEVSQLSQFIQSRTGEVDLGKVSSEFGVQMGQVADVQEILRENNVSRVKYQQSKSQKETTSTETARERQFREAIFLIESTDMEYTQKSYGELSEKEKTGLLFTDKKVENKTPDNQLFDQWKNEKEFALWIDGKSVANTVLAKYEAKDFVMWFQSGVKANARTGRFPQPFQVNLYSPKYFEESFGPNSDMFRPRTNRDTITITQRNLTSMKDLSRFPDPVTAFLQKNARYEKLKASPNASEPDVKQEIQRLFEELESEYSKTPDNKKKRLKKPVAPNTGLSGKTISAIPQNKTTYWNLYSKFETKVNRNGLYVKFSQDEFARLEKEYQMLDKTYIGLSLEDKMQVKRPSFPFVKLTQGGKVIYKKIEDLTEEEKKNMVC